MLPQLLNTNDVTSVRLPIYNQFFGGDALEPDEDPAALDPAAAPVLTDSTRVAMADSVPAAPEPTASVSPAADATRSPTALPDSEALEPTAYVPPAADATTTDSANVASASSPNLPRQATTYLFVNTEFTLSRFEQPALLQFIEAGNDVFIAAESIDTTLTQALGVRVAEVDSSIRPSLRGPDSVQVKFVDPALASATLRLPASAATNRLTVRPGQAATTLATDAQGRAVLVRLTRGRGHVYLCTVPLAFANYFVLPPRQRQFALAALSYLPTGRPVWWDEYQKQGRAGDQSVLRVLLAHESLRVAYYLLWATTLLFIFVEARRRQRIIPIYKPLPNTTLLFTRTVASLYQQGRNHQRIAEKKVALFLDYLRTRFHEPAPDLGDEAFRERLSQKAGLPRPRVEELVRLINFARTAPTVTDQELLRLSRAIHDFKREST